MFTALLEYQIQCTRTVKKIRREGEGEEEERKERTKKLVGEQDEKHRKHIRN